MIIDSTDYIQHYGVKGMRWGVRRAPSASSKLSTNSKTNGKPTAASKLSTNDKTARGKAFAESEAKKAQESLLTPKNIAKTTAIFVGLSLARRFVTEYVKIQYG